MEAKDCTQLLYHPMVRINAKVYRVEALILKADDGVQELVIEDGYGNVLVPSLYGENAKAVYTQLYKCHGQSGVLVKRLNPISTLSVETIVSMLVSMGLHIFGGIWTHMFGQNGQYMFMPVPPKVLHTFFRIPEVEKVEEL